MDTGQQLAAAQGPAGSSHLWVPDGPTCGVSPAAVEGTRAAVCPSATPDWTVVGEADVAIAPVDEHVAPIPGTQAGATGLAYAAAVHAGGTMA